MVIRQRKGSDLTAEEKETVSAITNLLGTATGGAIGDTTANAVQGSLNAESAIKNNNAGTFGITSLGDLYNNQGVAENMADIHSFAINSFSQNKGDVAKTMQDINDYVACKGCTTAGHKYIESLATLPLEAGLIVGTRGMSHIPQGAKALWYSGRIGKIARNEKAVTFTINGSANASMNAALDESQRTAGAFTYNFVVGGTAGVAASRMPTPAHGSIAQGAVYGHGQLAKDIVTEKNAPQPSTGEAWSNAGKAFVGGYLGSLTGNKAANVTSKYFPKTSGTTKTAIDAFFGSSTSASFNKITEEKK